jgi:hypothetical protein
MCDISLFFNAEIEGSGAFAWVGNLGLTPVRYLFGGRTISVETNAKSEQEVWHIESFHEAGEWHRQGGLRSGETSYIRTLLAVAFLVPGLLLIVFKAISYAFEDVREKHALAKQHFIPVVRQIGSKESPITNIDQLKEGLRAEWAKPLHQPTDAIVIHGNGSLEINAEPGILEFNPIKLILVGAKIVHKPCAVDRLDDRMGRTGKWKGAETFRQITSAQDVNKASIGVNVFGSVQEALDDPLTSRGWFTCKKWHVVYQAKA